MTPEDLLQRVGATSGSHLAPTAHDAAPAVAHDTFATAHHASCKTAFCGALPVGMGVAGAIMIKDALTGHDHAADAAANNPPPLSLDLPCAKVKCGDFAKQTDSWQKAFQAKCEAEFDFKQECKAQLELQPKNIKPSEAFCSDEYSATGLAVVMKNTGDRMSKKEDGEQNKNSASELSEQVEESEERNQNENTNKQKLGLGQQAIEDYGAFFDHGGRAATTANLEASTAARSSTSCSSTKSTKATSSLKRGSRNMTCCTPFDFFA
ncbi:unnamed protein product [Amoebophrya sp. A120]|nr:unnamed protein product [Amoebophrya sp. A120]|eukprot:GSA120T00012423001.1